MDTQTLIEFYEKYPACDLRLAQLVHNLERISLERLALIEESRNAIAEGPTQRQIEAMELLRKMRDQNINAIDYIRSNNISYYEESRNITLIV